METVESAKISLISSLASLSTSDEYYFIKECTDLIMDYAEYNLWIDPIIASSDIKVGVLCENIWTLYTTLEDNTSIQNDDGSIEFDYYIAKTN